MDRYAESDEDVTPKRTSRWKMTLTAILAATAGGSLFAVVLSENLPSLARSVLATPAPEIRPPMLVTNAETPTPRTVRPTPAEILISLPAPTRTADTSSPYGSTAADGQRIGTAVAIKTAVEKTMIATTTSGALQAKRTPTPIR